MIELLVAQPLLLVFLVLAVGYAAGRISIAGVQLGIAAVLFAGLAAGAFDARLQLPEFVRSFGLVIFVYSVGITSGPGFVASMRRRGLRDTAWTVSLLCLAAALASLAERMLHLPSGLTAGLFCGALTNTPALAAVLERLPAGSLAPVVGYSIAYPMGALGLVLALAVARRRWRSDLGASARGGELDVRFLVVANVDAVGRPVKDLRAQWGVGARFVRHDLEFGSYRQVKRDGRAIATGRQGEVLDCRFRQHGDFAARHVHGG